MEDHVRPDRLVHLVGQHGAGPREQSEGGGGHLLAQAPSGGARHHLQDLSVFTELSQTIDCSLTRPKLGF